MRGVGLILLAVLSLGAVAAAFIYAAAFHGPAVATDRDDVRCPPGFRADRARERCIGTGWTPDQ